MSSIYAASAALIAAWLTAAFAFFTLLSSKHSKVSEFRQDWINKLRDEISGFVRDFNRCQLIQKKRDRLRNQEEEKARNKLDEQFYDYYSSLLRHKAQIRLRVNLKDSDKKLKDENTKLIAYLSVAEDALNEHQVKISQDITDKIVCTSSEILKLEWERVKKGERGFRILLVTCSMILLIGLFGIAFVLKALPSVAVA